MTKVIVDVMVEREEKSEKAKTKEMIDAHIIGEGNSLMKCFADTKELRIYMKLEEKMDHSDCMEKCRKILSNYKTQGYSLHGAATTINEFAKLWDFIEEMQKKVWLYTEDMPIKDMDRALEIRKTCEELEKSSTSHRKSLKKDKRLICMYELM